MTNVGPPITSLTLIPRINNSPLAAYGGKIIANFNIVCEHSYL